MDTWWQTETGGFMITPLPGAIELKAGSATRPFFGVQPVLVDNEGTPLEGATEGNLAIADSWPGQARTCSATMSALNRPTSPPSKICISAATARRDEDGYFWITGRVDDVLNVSGHRLGTAEIESALVSHPKIAEAAVVGIPHNIKGQAIYAYVTLNHGEEPTPELYAEVRNWVRKEIGPLARRTCCTGPIHYRKPARARSCAVFCARLPRAIPATSAIRQHWRILASWKNCSKRSRPLRCRRKRTHSLHLSPSGRGHKSYALRIPRSRTAGSTSLPDSTLPGG
jgi:acetyl-CoA synthetase